MIAIKIERAEEKILASLSKDAYIRAADLSERINLSEKTIRQHINSISDYLKKHGAYIESVRGKGYRLVIEDKEQFDKLNSDGMTVVNALTFTQEDRVDFIISCLLARNDYFDVLALCEMLNISEATLRSDIRSAKERIQEYNLEIISQRKKGMKIIGNLYDIRSCMARYIKSTKIFSEEQLRKINDQKLIIMEIVLRILEQYQITVQDILLENFLNQIVIMIYQIKSGRTLLSLPDRPSWETSHSTKLYSAVRKICDELSKIFDITISEIETDYMLINMIGMSVKDRHSSEKSNFVIPQEITELVREILDFIYEMMKIDFRNNFSLFMTLSIHMLPLMVRMKYNIKVENPLLFEIKKNFALGYTIALQASVIMERKGQKKLSDEELGYLALIFEAEIKKTQSGQQKRNLVIVCATGTASAELLAYQYKKNFSDYINEIRICNIHELKSLDFNGIDYIFSTVPIRYDVPVPIIKTNFFLGDDDIVDIKRILQKERIDWLPRYFKRELFFKKISFRSKEDVLRFICDEICRTQEVHGDLYKSVLSREEMGNTDFGELVALPHPKERMTEKTFVCVVVLDQPVFWGTHDISVVFLISVSESQPEDMNEFYQIVSEFFLNTSKAKRLIKNPSYDHLLYLLEEK